MDEPVRDCGGPSDGDRLRVRGEAGGVSRIPEMGRAGQAPGSI